MSHADFTRGLLAALAAGLVWGLVFVAPTMLADYPPAMLAIGRYLAFGLICLPLAWRDRRRLSALRRADWLAALELAAIGNLCYYLCLAAALQLAGGPVPTLIIGTLPVVIALVANLNAHTPLPWLRLAPSLLLIGAGLACVHQQELPAANQPTVLIGLVLAVAALACWTWYPLRNARWLKRNPTLSPSTWATAQGLATLPLAAAGLAIAALHFTPASGYAFPLGPRPGIYLGLMLAIGLLASWLGTLLWNEASRLLPTALSGQLIVFETLAALAYAYLWRREWPSTLSALGIALLVGGVLCGVRAFRQPRAAVAAQERL